MSSKSRLRQIRSVTGNLPYCFGDLLDMLGGLAEQCVLANPDSSFGANLLGYREALVSVVRQIQPGQEADCILQKASLLVKGTVPGTARHSLSFQGFEKLLPWDPRKSLWIVAQDQEMESVAVHSKVSRL